MGLINSLASIFTLSESMKIATLSLAPYKTDGSDAADLPKERAFQYYPEAIQDTRAVNYAEKNIPGGSHPIYQWISGGARSLSFSAFFSDEINDEADAGFGLNVTSNGPLGPSDDLHNATGGIASAIAWLRGFTYPSYEQGKATAPPRAALFMPGSGITSGVAEDSVPVIMTQCDVAYQSFFRNGKARFIEVSLAFNETVQIGEDWKFVGREKIWGDSQGSLITGPKAYTKPRGRQAEAGGFLSFLGF